MENAAIGAVASKVSNRLMPATGRLKSCPPDIRLPSPVLTADERGRRAPCEDSPACRISRCLPPSLPDAVHGASIEMPGTVTTDAVASVNRFREAPGCVQVGIVCRILEAWFRMYYFRVRSPHGASARWRRLPSDPVPRIELHVENCFKSHAGDVELNRCRNRRRGDHYRHVQACSILEQVPAACILTWCR